MGGTEYQFGDWRVEPDQNRIVCGDVERHLEPLCMDVLTLLLEHSGETVSTDRLLDVVWRNRIVEPNAVQRALNQIRKALGDDPKDPKYIQTIRKRGYRTVGVVRPSGQVADSRSPTGDQQSGVALPSAPTAIVPGADAQVAVSPRWRWYLLAGTLVAVVGGSAWWLGQDRTESTAPPIVESRMPSIAVLPFLNMSSDPGQQFFADGIAEEILSLLARNPELKVISRSSAFSFRDRNVETPVIADQLNVEYVLDGSVRRSGEQVRIAARLIEARTDSYRWSETFDRTIDDVFAIQTEIAKRVAEHLNVALRDLRPPTYSYDSEAYAYYSQARYILGLRGTLNDTLRAKALLDQAIDIDPNYVPAWTELSRAYLHLSDHGFLTAEEGHRLIDQALATALSLDPDDAVANAWYGWNASVWDGEFEKGVPYFKKGLSLDPTNLDVLRTAVPLLHILGTPEDSLALAEYVVERDPLCVICIDNLGRTYMMLGRFSDAERVLLRGHRLSPDNLFVMLQLGENRLVQGEYEAAVSWFDRLPTDWGLARKVMVFHALGNTEDLHEALESLNMRSKYRTLATYYAWAEDAQNASEYLERSFAAKEEWHQFFLNRHLWGAQLGQDRRWQRLLESFGLSPQQVAELDFTVRVPG